MELYILRHGIAEAKNDKNREQDSVRELTKEGEEKMWRIAEGMKAAGFSFDLILTSPYLRAKQTADIVAEVLKLKKVLKLSAALAPGAEHIKLVDELSKKHAARKSVLLVGHEPHLSRLISLLLSGAAELAIDLKKGGLCLLTVEKLQSGRCAKLEWLLTPKQIRSFGRETAS